MKMTVMNAEDCDSGTGARWGNQEDLTCQWMAPIDSNPNPDDSTA